jgi:hypothetical protein
LRDEFTTLVIPHDGAPRVLLQGETPILDGRDDAVQLPMLARDGRPSELARDWGARRPRAALCFLDGHLILARAIHDSSDVVTQALLTLGCRDVLGLDRGSHHEAFVHRAGTSLPPQAEYEVSVLHWLGGSARPRAFSF